ncbi:MAG: energy transducer TonB [Burkholderiales bacterium]|jgi:protein TonB|nr:energy transducer TonB [Burkholderiales bacterium]
MSAALAVSFREPVLPWSTATDDEARYHRILRRVLGLCLVLFVTVPWIPIVKPDRSAPQDLPPRLAKLVLERETPPPPPPAPAVKSERMKEEAVKHDGKPEPVKAAPLKKAAAVPEARNPVPNKPPGEALENARRKASGIGLLAMKNEIQEMQNSAPVAVQLNKDIKQGPGVGTGVGAGVGAGNEPGLPTRALITSNAAGGSGGINTAGYSRNTGGGGLAGRATTLVEGAAGGGGGGGAGGGGSRGGKGDGAGTGGGGGGTVHRGNSGKASRSLEDIRLVFERNKGALYAIYNRALRDEPALQGRVVLELKISPSGQVVDCRILSSELKAHELESKLLARIKQFDFGAKEVDQMTVSWPLDLLPS